MPEIGESLATIATLKAVSKPFDGGKRAEVKLIFRLPYHGELYIRIPASISDDWIVGEAYALQLRRLGP